ncbi:MAG: MarR family winged helix-turn-helix transcriptional regulator [Planctomycetaceae bacterium]|nr:MarR family winged helix-turn-helix transcriptional regulator [Planctomycetaceae bacterium]
MTSRKQPALDPQECVERFWTCGCTNLRMAARVVTQFYDEVLQPSGLRATQLGILTTIAARPSATIVILARELGMDPSTLNRNLRPLKRRGLVRSMAAPGGRGRCLALTAKGASAVLSAIPLWDQAQQQFVARLGERRWRQLFTALRRLSGAASA